MKKNPKELKEKMEQLIDQHKENISIVVKIDHEYIVDHNSKKVYSSASIIKIPIIMEAYRQAEKGVIDLSKSMEVKENLKVGGSGVVTSLSNGTVLTIKDLLTLMIIVSDNTATNMMIDLLGKESINQFCTLIGCENTIIERKLMDYEAREKGYDNKTTAYDMLLLLQEIDNSQWLTEKSGKEILNIMGKQQFQDKLPAMMDTETMFVANKTGEIPGVEHDVAILHYQNHHICIAVLIDQLTYNYSGKKTIAQIGKLINDYLLEDK